MKDFIKRILGIYEFDRLAEKLIKKSIYLYHKGDKFNFWRAIRIYNKIRKNYNCNIFPGISVGENLYIAHAHNVLIGKTTIIGNNCKFYPNSYIVAAVKGDEERWNNRERRHAKIGNDCIIGNSALIIGPIEIGNDVTIAAGAIVTKNVPDHSVVKNTNEIRPKNKDEIPEKYLKESKQNEEI